MQPATHLDTRNLKATPSRFHTNANLLLCRLMIEQAFKCACQTEHGAPTPIAYDAVAWLTCDLDWTRTGLMPPDDIRQEYVLSFQWCCEWLDLNPDVVRQQGLPPGCVPQKADRHRLRIRPRQDTGRRIHVAGLPAVYACWERVKQQQGSASAAAEHEQLFVNV